MNEPTAEIEHLIQHYLHRDLFRLHARLFLARHRSRASVPSVIGSVSFYKDYGSTYNEQDWELNRYVVDATRESLKRAKPTTVQYLHQLLHDAPMLEEHSHIHSDGVIFTFVIHEDEEISA
jgi:hypothetical protein